MDILANINLYWDQHWRVLYTLVKTSYRISEHQISLFVEFLIFLEGVLPYLCVGLLHWLIFTNNMCVCEYICTHTYTQIYIYTITQNIIIFKVNVIWLRRFYYLYCTVYNVKFNTCVYLYRCYTSLNYNKSSCWFFGLLLSVKHFIRDPF